MSYVRNIAASVFVIVAMMAAWTAPAKAVLVFEFQRLNDSQTILSGSGSYDGVTPIESLLFADIASTGNAGIIDSLVGTFQIGSVAPIPFNHFIDDGENDYLIFLDGAFVNGDMPSGSSLATLDVETWNPAGSSGLVFGRAATRQLFEIGTWEIVAPRRVPEPAALLFVGFGLLGISLSRRRVQ